MTIQQVLFIIITFLAFGVAGFQFLKLRKKVFLGQAQEIKGNALQRWRQVFLVAFGQKKMFKRWLPALFHLFIYVAFLLTLVEMVEILIDGAFGVHRFFAGYLGEFYTFIISFVEILSALALIATIVFLSRRLVLKLSRFHKAEMTWWPKLDGVLILVLEFALIVAIFTMNGTDVVLQGIDPDHFPATGTLPISSILGPLLFGGIDYEILTILERMGWWLHIIVVYAFMNYLPYSKHLHIFFAFPNVYYSPLKSRGEMENMPAIMNEVKSMMGLTESTEIDDTEDLPEFGAKDILDLGWKSILDAFTCTECGRCTDNCPANLTGKKLSPRKVMMDIRDRTEDVFKKLNSGDETFQKDKEKPLSKSNFDDGKSLFDYISKEEIRACTTCNACVEACPVMINPLEPILQMRRYEILTESDGPADWLPMFNALESSGAVWQMSDARDAWNT